MKMPDKSYLGSLNRGIRWSPIAIPWTAFVLSIRCQIGLILEMHEISTVDSWKRIKSLLKDAIILMREEPKIKISNRLIVVMFFMFSFRKILFALEEMKMNSVDFSAKGMYK